MPIHRTYIKNIDVIYNGINVNISNNGAIDNNTQNNIKNILMIGNFAVNKGQKHFIMAANDLCRRHKDYEFTIIGNAYDKEYYLECMKFNSRVRVTRKNTYLSRYP
mgnify:CR=1 FL=1